MKSRQDCSHDADHRSAPQTSRQGVVLIVVLILVAMVALAGFAFLNTTLTEYEAVKLQGDLIQARHVMDSAETALLWFAEQPPPVREAAGGWRNNPRLFRGRLIDDSDSLGEALDGLVDDSASDLRWRFTVVSPSRDTGSGAPWRFGLQNESARVDLATLLSREQEFPGSGFNALMELPGMTPEAADSILDWIDEDDTPRNAGAEAAYYRDLPRPCRPRNDLPQSLDELLFVKGVSKQMLDGTAAESPGMAPSQLDSAATGMTDRPVGLRDYLTLYSAERNADPSGQPKWNLNSEQFLMERDRLRALVDDDVLQFITLARQYGLADGVGGGVSVSSVTVEDSVPLSYSIQSLSDLIDATVVLPGTGDPTTVASPLQSVDTAFGSRFTPLVEHATTINGDVITGRVNIHEAAEPVLRTLPSLSPETVSQIVVRRSTLNMEQRGSVTWLLTEGLLDLQTFRSIFDDITTGGDVFRGEIIVFREVGGPVLRKNLVIDAANRPATTVVWTDLSEQGLPAPLTFLTSSPGEFGNDLRSPLLP